MPGYDGTGPLGKGPATGRGFGDCGDMPRRQFVGRVSRRHFAARASGDDQISDISSYKKALEDELKKHSKS